MDPIGRAKQLRLEEVMGSWCEQGQSLHYLQEAAGCQSTPKGSWDMRAVGLN